MGINRCKTQEIESGGGEAKIEANVDNNVEAKMNMDEWMVDGHLETFPTLILETLAVASENQRETEETESGGEETKVKADAYEGERVDEVAMGEMTEDGNTEDSWLLILKTLAVVNEKLRETENMKGGGKEGKTRSRSKRNTI